MDWTNENYVRLYTRDTTTWKLMDWRGRTVLMHLIRKVDRAGVLDVGGDGVLGLAAVLELPLELVEAGVDQLTTRRGTSDATMIDTGSAFVLPNFLEAQEASQSDKQRKRASRERRRDVAVARSRNLLPVSQNVTESPELAASGHGNEEAVTLSSASLSSADQNLSPARAIPGTPEPGPCPGPEARSAARSRIRAGLEAARARAGGKRNVRVTPLLAFDRGIDVDLNDHLTRATTLDALELVERQAHKAVAMAELEVTHGGKSFQWFTGAIFSGGNFARLAGMTAEDAKRSQTAGKGGATSLPAPERRPDPGPPPVVSTLSPEERSAAWAQLHGSKEPA